MKGHDVRVRRVVSAGVSFVCARESTSPQTTRHCLAVFLSVCPSPHSRLFYFSLQHLQLYELLQHRHALLGTQSHGNNLERQVLAVEGVYSPHHDPAGPHPARIPVPARSCRHLPRWGHGGWSGAGQHSERLALMPRRVISEPPGQGRQHAVSRVQHTQHALDHRFDPSAGAHARGAAAHSGATGHAPERAPASCGAPSALCQARSSGRCVRLTGASLAQQVKDSET